MPNFNEEESVIFQNHGYTTKETVKCRMGIGYPILKYRGICISWNGGEFFICTGSNTFKQFDDGLPAIINYIDSLWEKYEQ